MSTHGLGRVPMEDVGGDANSVVQPVPLRRSPALGHLSAAQPAVSVSAESVKRKEYEAKKELMRARGLGRFGLEPVMEKDGDGDDVPVKAFEPVIPVQEAHQPEEKKKHKRAHGTTVGHPDCPRCLKKKSQAEFEGPSAWTKYLRDFQFKNPGMSKGESEIEARKYYIKPNGRAKSYERIYRDVWRARHPTWKVDFNAAEAKDKMRADFLVAI